jgi:photosystem I P700 chlorophyll a apoprotein A2
VELPPSQRLAAAALILIGVSASAHAQEPAPVAAPGKTLDVQGQVLDLQGKVLDVVGVTSGIEGALADLGAKVTEQEIRIELSADVLFDFDKADLRPEAQESLRKVATVIAANPGRPIRIEGHTDSKGADAYNQALSDRRAASVKSWLANDGGVEAARISTVGLGETRPKVPNEKPDGSDDPEGRQQNRRVEITVQKQP